MNRPFKRPRVLFFDIETSPMIGYIWGLYDQNVSLNQIKKDWHVLSWAAKWQDSKKILYSDQRKCKNIEDDKKILKEIWCLLDSADIVVTQNGKRFDVKKLNARFAIHNMKPYSSFKHIDTLLLAKKYFAFTSNKLEYLSNTLNKKYKKLKHSKFEGFELWKQCLAGNMRAWKEMEKYNKYDVLALEEVYDKLVAWDSSINFNLYTDNIVNRCKCGNDKVIRIGFGYTATGKFQRYRCTKCGSETRSRINEFSKEKRDSLKVSSPR